MPIALITRVLAGEATAEEKLQLTDWREAMAENEKEYQAITKLWRITESAASDESINLDEEWQVLDRKILGKTGRILSLKRALQLAASIIVLFGFVYLFVQQMNTVSTKTAAAETTTVVLPDGTKISLNAKSKINYDNNYGITNRHVTLKGEGYFEVSSNKQLPFVVSAQGASIRVVGTQFNVKAYKNQSKVKVTVIQGTVELFASDAPQKLSVLTAGQTGVYVKKKKVIEKRAMQDINDISWKTKYIRFENTPLADVIVILNNTYHHDFKLADTMKNCRVTVEFHDKDLAAVLKVLKSTLDLTITIKNNTVVISGKGCDN